MYREFIDSREFTDYAEYREYMEEYNEWIDRLEADWEEVKQDEETLVPF